jgi:Zn-dependent protease
MEPATIDHLRWGMLELILLIISIGLHEFGHAWAADLRGDPLPRIQGRVTLNPFAHVDPIGTILIPAVMIFLSPGFGIIGWGKPVQISLPNPKTRRVDDIIITLAGPAMNIVLCFVLLLIGVIGDVSPAQGA